MMMKYSIPKVFYVIIFAIIFFYGCVPAPPFVTGEALEREQIKEIQPGKTTKREVFQLFGAPMAILEKDEIVKLPAETIWVAKRAEKYSPEETTWEVKGDVRRGGYYEINSDIFFELFSQKHTITEAHRIYYYYHAVSKKTGYIFISNIYESGRTDIDRLWILINEQTGIVEDYIFRGHR